MSAINLGNGYDEEWRKEAECLKRARQAKVLANAWTTQDEYLKAVAKDICVNDCKVRALCLFDAVFGEDPTPEGLRGGFEFDMGRVTNEERLQIYREYKIPLSKIKRKYRKADLEYEEDAENEEMRARID